MSVVETERLDGVMVIRMNRPERMNALGLELRTALAEAWNEFRDSGDLEVAILTGTGRAFCAGQDMKEALELQETLGTPVAQRPRADNPYDARTIDKPIIAAINGFAMGGGFQLAERADLRIAVRGAVLVQTICQIFQFLRDPRPHGTHHYEGVHPRCRRQREQVAGHLSCRGHELILINNAVEEAKLVQPLGGEAKGERHLGRHRVRQAADEAVIVASEEPPLCLGHLEDGAKEDLIESRRAFADKRPPQFKGWDEPEDRLRTPTLESVRHERLSEV